MAGVGERPLPLCPPLRTQRGGGALRYHCAMKLSYDPETDSLYIHFSEIASVDSEEIADGVVVDYAEDGEVVGIDIEHASRKVDLTTLEAHSLPVAG